MNKKLASTRLMLNKNLANTECLTLIGLNVSRHINASFAKINNLGVANIAALCSTLNLSTEIPDVYYEGSINLKHDRQLDI